jgi:hypothetical protein
MTECLNVSVWTDIKTAGRHKMSQDYNLTRHKQKVLFAKQILAFVRWKFCNFQMLFNGFLGGLFGWFAL